MSAKRFVPIRSEIIYYQLGLPINITSVAFIAMEYWAILLNRTFLVFVWDRYLWGIKVKGIVMAPLPPFEKRWHHLGYFLTDKFFRRYPEIATPSESLLEKSWHNFRIDLSEISRVAFDPTPKWGMGTVPHSGKLYLDFKSGKQRELILISDQDGHKLASDLQSAVDYFG